MKIECAHMEDNKPVTYMITEYTEETRGIRTTTLYWICLCTNGQWVNEKYMRDDDVRLEFVGGHHTPRTAAEKLTKILLGR